MAVIEMSVSEWVKVADNPRQRDTERRASIAGSRHLKEYSKTHDFVFAASVDGEVLCKLDGHTRAFLWANGSLEAPPSGKVHVLLIDVANMAEAKDLYDRLDSSDATKKTCDIIFGATRENKFRLKSQLLHKCSFGTQLKIAENGKKFSGDSSSLVMKWKTELLLLDSIGLSSKYTVLISVMLCTIKRDGIELASQFWTLLDQNKGTKSKDGGSDGVQSLHEHVHIRRAEGRMSGYENLIGLSSKAIYAYEMWKDSKRIKRHLGSVDVGEWIGTIHGRKKSPLQV